MPQVKGSGKGATNIVSVRLDPKTHDYFKKTAQRNGTSLAEFLRLTLVRGVTMDSIKTIESSMWDPQGEHRDLGHSRLNERELLALFTSCEILCEIARQRDPEALKGALERARIQVKNALTETIIG
jgi:hypothetical protein